ncbi:MAG: molecular chaperone TorD family protein [Phycisphaeraceae bacterium]|nr:molecular chaperone TorD family protein [Phycisphaeraceae bacterium]
MTHDLADPVRLCALADLLLLGCDTLRPPELATRSLRDIDAALEGLLAAAGAESGSSLAAAMHEVARQALLTDLDAWRDEHYRLFEGAMLCPLNQTAYVRRDKGAILGDLCGFYSAFGFAASRNTGEKPDHLLTELEFLAILLVMLARATGESRLITRKAIGSLAEDHLCDWIAGAWERLALVTSLPYYAAVADLFREIWTHLAGQLDLPPAQATAPDLAASEPEDPYECGMAPPGGSVQMQVHGEPIDPLAPPVSSRS